MRDDSTESVRKNQRTPIEKRAPVCASFFKGPYMGVNREDEERKEEYERGGDPRR